MAKVGTEMISHKGSGVSMVIDINFYTKGKYFKAMGMPKEIEDWYGAKLTRECTDPTKNNYTGEITALSYDECLSEARKAYSSYFDQKVSDEKVICYLIKVNYPKPKDQYYGGKNEIHFAPTLAIGIQHKIMYRIKVGDEVFFSTANYERSRQPEQGVAIGGHRMERDGFSSSLKDWVKIPYTEQAHEFFKNAESGLLSMILKVEDFFGSDPEMLLEKIQSGKLLNS